LKGAGAVQKPNKRTYATPALTSYGSIAKLTQGTSGDGGGGGGGGASVGVGISGNPLSVMATIML
jgi:hypothetical protein